MTADLTDAVIRLGKLSLQFGRVNRITFHPPDERRPDAGLMPESDTTHTVMLGLIACAIADEYVAYLDRGLVAEFALVHDLVEAYAGDMPTLRALGVDQKAEKKAREHLAYSRIRTEFGLDLPWVGEAIAAYERQELSEARFVRALDKLLPKITHIANDCATLRAQGMGFDELVARYEAQERELMVYASDFPVIFELRRALVDRVLAQYATAGVAA